MVYNELQRSNMIKHMSRSYFNADVRTQILELRSSTRDDNSLLVIAYVAIKWSIGWQQWTELVLYQILDRTR